MRKFLFVLDYAKKLILKQISNSSCKLKKDRQSLKVSAEGWGFECLQFKAHCLPFLKIVFSLPGSIDFFYPCRDHHNKGSWAILPQIVQTPIFSNPTPNLVPCLSMPGVNKKGCNKSLELEVYLFLRFIGHISVELIIQTLCMPPKWQISAF